LSGFEPKRGEFFVPGNILEKNALFCFDFDKLFETFYLCFEKLKSAIFFWSKMFCILLSEKRSPPIFGFLLGVNPQRKVLDFGQEEHF